MINDWIKSLSDGSGNQIQLDQDGMCAVAVSGDQDIVIQVNDATSMVRLLAYVNKVTYTSNEGILEDVMSENFQSTWLDGCQISLCPESRRFVLAVSLPTELIDERLFSNVVGNFISVLKRCDSFILSKDTGQNSGSAVGLEASSVDGIADSMRQISNYIQP